MLARLCRLLVPVCVLLMSTRLGGQNPETSDPDFVARRVGEYVEGYLAVARTIIAREEVTLQPMTMALAPSGPARRLVYETRVAWEPTRGDEVPAATVQRTLLSVDGVARRGERDECLPPTSKEPLAFLLPAFRRDYGFQLAPRPGRDNALVLTFTPLTGGRPSLTWRGDCGSLEVPGHLEGELTLDRTTLAVRLLEQRLKKPVRIPVSKEQRRDDWGDVIELERFDVSIAYRSLQFHQPDEQLILPVDIRRVTVVRTPAVRALQVTQRYANHRRFVTDVRVVPPR